MKLIESIRLRFRAYKYKNKNDKGGIAYINTAIQDGQTVFDIGAHKAGYLYWMLKRVGKKGKVVAFEPQAKLYHYLRKIKTLFKLDNVTIEHIALSDTEREVMLYIPANTYIKVPRLERQS